MQCVQFCHRERLFSAGQASTSHALAGGSSRPLCWSTCHQHSWGRPTVNIKVALYASATQSLTGRYYAAAVAETSQIVLTREQGKNAELQRRLEARGLQCLELPLIEAIPGPDRELLPGKLQTQRFDWIAVTSPEAANVFLQGWRSAGRPQVRIALVGAGSGRPIESEASNNLTIDFVASKANAEHLAAELPPLAGGNMQVLYPASAKAGSDIQEGLTARGFHVTRLNTYSTIPVGRLDERQLAEAKKAQVVAVASPSALKAWVHFIGSGAANGFAYACIGSTSARAAEKLGLKHVYHPQRPGLDGFVSSIEDALAACQTSAAAC